MKQLIILLLLIIAFFIGFGKYQQYKRYNTPSVTYKSDKEIDFNYHNKETLTRYHEAIEELNGYIILQWSANNIDVRAPENDDNKTNIALKQYSQKLAKVKFYETILENSLTLKKEGLTNKEIKYLEDLGITLNQYKHDVHINNIKKMYVPNKTGAEQNRAFVYEIQKELTKKGFRIDADGIYEKGTSNALKEFEAKNNLFADGNLDLLTINALFR